MLFVDQPFGVGFSVTNDPVGTSSTEEAA